MQIQEMRSYIRGLLDIDSTDISDDILNRFIGEGYDQVVYSEKRWPFYEVEQTFTTVDGTKDYDLKTDGTILVETMVMLSILLTLEGTEMSGTFRCGLRKFACTLRLVLVKQFMFVGIRNLLLLA